MEGGGWTDLYDVFACLDLAQLKGRATPDRLQGDTKNREGTQGRRVRGAETWLF